MVTRVSTVALEGIEARAVDVQVQITPGTVAFTIVGPDGHPVTAYDDLHDREDQEAQRVV